MGLWGLLIFLALPIAEIATFIWVGGAIGVLPTLLLVVLAAVLGAAVIRAQGVQALDRLRASLDRGGDPTGPLAHGALAMIAGVLLIVPGFLTDIAGLLLLVPPVRALLIRRGASRVTVRAASYVRPGGAARPSEVIEADYEVIDEPQPPRRRGDSGWTRRG